MTLRKNILVSVITVLGLPPSPLFVIKWFIILNYEFYSLLIMYVIFLNVMRFFKWYVI